MRGQPVFFVASMLAATLISSGLGSCVFDGNGVDFPAPSAPDAAPESETCGDGTCATHESCSSCPADCDTCPPEPVCGDGTCADGESCDSCPGDCICEADLVCGDDVCEAPETCTSCEADCGACVTGSVSASAETEKLSDDEDAEDAAVWIHPSDPAASTVIGTARGEDGGLHVYDLAGEEIQFLELGPLSGVDLRYGFPLDGSSVTLVAAGKRSDDSIALYRVNPSTRELESLPGDRLRLEISIYGSCMYRNAATGKYYFFATAKSGEGEQWDDGSGHGNPRTPRP